MAHLIFLILHMELGVKSEKSKFSGKILVYSLGGKHGSKIDYFPNFQKLCHFFSQKSHRMKVLMILNFSLQTSNLGKFLA